MRPNKMQFVKKTVSLCTLYDLNDFSDHLVRNSIFEKFGDHLSPIIFFQLIFDGKK